MKSKKKQTRSNQEESCWVSIGRKWDLELTDTGFTLWDRKTSKWVIDASMLTEVNFFSISKTLKKVDGLSPSHLNFSGFYTDKKKPRAKNATSNK